MISTVSITDLKQNTAQVIEKVKLLDEPTYILQHSEVAAVLVSPQFIEAYEQMQELLEDMEDIRVAESRMNEETMSLDDYIKERFGTTS